MRISLNFFSVIVLVSVKEGAGSFNLLLKNDGLVVPKYRQFISSFIFFYSKCKSTCPPSMSILMYLFGLAYGELLIHNDLLAFYSIPLAYWNPDIS